MPFFRNMQSNKTGYESLYYQRLYKEKLLDEIKNREESQGKIRKEYEEHIDNVIENLEKSNPQYKLLKEKKVELLKVQIQCRVLQTKIEERKKINKLRSNIRKRMFYAPIIKFAQAWIDRRNYSERMKKWEALVLKEKEVIEKLTESSERLKQLQREKKKSTDEAMLNNFPEVCSNLIIQRKKLYSCFSSLKNMDNMKNLTR